MTSQPGHQGLSSNDHILEVSGVEAGYGKMQVLFDVSFLVKRGEIVLIIGPNGAGKSTILKAIIGMIRVSSGKIRYNGHEIQNRHPSRSVKEGVGLLPQGGRVFPELSVQDNMEIGAYLISSKSLTRERLQEMYEIFPVLTERRKQQAGTLSGGERQMLSFARALVLKPELLLLDEPSGGLAPVLVNEMLEMIQRINRELGTTMLMVEQKVRQALHIANRVHMLKLGKIFYETDRPEELLDVATLRSLYVS